MALSSLVVSCGAQWVAPKPYTLRSDAFLRRSLPGQDPEIYAIPDFIEKIKKDELKEIAYVITPADEKNIADHIIEQDAKILELENRIKDGCR